ncbi:MAG TPA: ASPIC/UnbV domain-containing protein [Bryobacteraceae bacterium]|nr:ASPIC/UnbV domain-containing protein [Bryobacteraceae bacterium]
MIDKPLWLALTLAVSALQAQPQASDAASILQHALALHQAGDLEGAISAYREYLAREPDSVEARSNLGVVLARSVFVDLNNDGFPDLVVTSLGERPRILMNSADNGNHWLTVNTVGRRSNRDGIGAALRLTTASGRLLYDHVTTSVGFMSSSDKRVHFGLGQEKDIASLEIRWPGGAVQRVKRPKADQILTLHEPAR